MKIIINIVFLLRMEDFMRKILLVLLLIFLLPLSACGEVKYEFKDGVMYEDGKEATGTFELTVNGFKSSLSAKLPIN